MKITLNFRNGRLVTRDDGPPDEPRKSDGEWTAGGGVGRKTSSASATAKAEERKVTLNKNALAIGGDEWNKKTSERLETEYELAKPDVEAIANAIDAKNKAIAKEDPLETAVNKLALEHTFPKHFDPLNETEEEDYRRTQKIAQAVATDRTMQLIKQRGIKVAAMDNGQFVGQFVDDVENADALLWSDWKGSSTSNGGLVIQLAIADEFGGRIREDALKGSHAQYGDNRNDIIKACNREQIFKRIGGYEGVKAMLRAKWETTQWLLDKAGIQDLKLYRAVNMYSKLNNADNKAPLVMKYLNKKEQTSLAVAAALNGTNEGNIKDAEKDIAATCLSRYGNAPLMVKPEDVNKSKLALMKNFQDSFAYCSFWQDLNDKTKQDLLDALSNVDPRDFVKETKTPPMDEKSDNYTVNIKIDNKPDKPVYPDQNIFKLLPNLSVMRNGAASTTTDPEIANDWGSTSGRVVLRAHVPRTAAISIPAYGMNVHSEHEVVIAGTAWHGWDAWLGQAPTFEQVALGGKVKGVILNAEQKAALQKVKDALHL